MTISQPTTATPDTRNLSRAQQTAILQKIEARAGTLTPPRAVAQSQAEAAVATNGAAAAALLAAGIGSTLFGLFVILSEASAAFHEAMDLDSSVGPLSGKSTYAMLAWLAIWGVLHMALRKRQVNFKGVAIVAAALIALGILSTFPPFYMLFAIE